MWPARAAVAGAAAARRAARRRRRCGAERSGAWHAPQNPTNAPRRVPRGRPHPPNRGWASFTNSQAAFRNLFGYRRIQRIGLRPSPARQPTYELRCTVLQRCETCAACLLGGGVLVVLASATTLALASRRIAAEQAAYSAPSAGRCTPTTLNARRCCPGRRSRSRRCPDSYDASPQTQISLLGRARERARDVRVSGSRDRLALRAACAATPRATARASCRRSRFAPARR